MTTFRTVFITNYKRMIPRKTSILVITIISMLAIGFGAYMANKDTIFSHIAVIEQGTKKFPDLSTGPITFERVKEKPPVSQLYEQKYDAYLTVDQQGKIKIDTLKGQEYTNMLMALIKDPTTKIGGSYKKNGVGETIVGYMLMFILMIALGNLFAFAEDKEQGQLKRIVCAPSSFAGYMTAHIMYSFSIFLPQIVLLIVMKWMGIPIGFSIPVFLFFLIVIGFLGSAVAILLNTCIQKPDNANMLGNSIMVLASVLSGAFYSFGRNNKVLDTIIMFIPQKQILNFAKKLELGQGHFAVSAMGYVFLLSFGMLLVSYVILQKKFVKKA